MTDRELMQQALDALTTYDGTNGEGKRKRVLAALRERLAQPNEFEPDWDQVEALQESLREHMAEIHRLRQWQGLTDEEIKIIWRDIDGSEGMLMRFARAIEAKLKEKNNAR